MNEQKKHEPATKHDKGKPAFELLDRWVWGKVPIRNTDIYHCLESLRAFNWEGAYHTASRLIGSSAAMTQEVAYVLAFGAKKYKANNWRKGMSWSRVYGAALRHLMAFARGEIRDPESGLHHLGHLGCRLMFLAVYERDGLGTNDLGEVVR